MQRTEMQTHTVRWPFAIREVRVVPLIAPEFRPSFERILTTTRSYLHLETEAGQAVAKRYLRR